MDKIGLVITTYNSPEYFETLFQSLPLYRDYELVVVNGGDPYEKLYKRISGEVHWIQHTENKGPAASRNDGLRKLHDLGCDHMFLAEDDLIFKSEDIFDRYIGAAKESGMNYLNFCSYAWGSGQAGNRTPKVSVEYSPNLTIDFYSNMNNEFTYRTRSLYEKVGEYREDMRNLFDCEWVYRASKETSMCSPFWFFPDINGSDNLIMNNPVAVSRIDPDNTRHQNTQNEHRIFAEQHGIPIQNVPGLTRPRFLERLKNIKDGNQLSN